MNFSLSKMRKILQDLIISFKSLNHKHRRVNEMLTFAFVYMLPIAICTVAISLILPNCLAKSKQPS